MRLGATLTHLSPEPPHAVAAWARRLVDAGFESLTAAREFDGWLAAASRRSTEEIVAAHDRYR